METRIASGVIGLALLIVILSAPAWCMKIAVALVSFIAIWELFSVCRLKNHKKLLVTGLLADAAIIASFVFDTKFILPILYVLVPVLFILFMTDIKNIRFKNVTKTLFGVLYISLFLGSLILIRDLENGRYLIWIVFVAAFFTDTFALIFGKIIGKHKMCPRLSPKKTVEGALGGVLGSVIGMILYCYMTLTYFKLTPNYIYAAIIFVLASVVSQIGDLAASSVKREYDVKDYGKIMPGHGGILDRLDSVMFVAPFVYYMLLFLPVL